MEYYHEGNTQSGVRAVFEIFSATLRGWEARYKAGELKPNYPKTRKKRKLTPSDELIDIVGQNPDAFLREIGDDFGCSHQTLEHMLVLCAAKKFLPLYQKKEPRN